MKKIVFFLQTPKPVGGGQILFMDIASYIAENNEDYQVYYINHYHEEIVNLYKSSKVKFIDVDRCNYKQFSDATFFVPYNYIFYLLAKIKEIPDVKIMIYFYHPHILSFLDNQTRKPKISFNNFLKLIQEKKSYCFMDSSNKSSIERISNIRFIEKYVPVCIQKIDNTIPNEQKLINSSEMNIGWLGRLDRDKMNSLINLTNNLYALDSNKIINLHIIGDGDAKGMLKMHNYNSKIRFIFTSYLYGKDRDTYIVNNVDLMVAMGMSATDSAQLGVPTIIPIVSWTPFREDRYIYVYDIEKYSLGWDIADIFDTNCKMYTIGEIVQDIYVRQKKKNIGEKCERFVLNTFSIKNASEALLKNINSGNLTVQDCMREQSIKKQMHRFSAYSKICKTNNYEEYHAFISEINRPTYNKMTSKVKFLLNKGIEIIKR